MAKEGRPTKYKPEYVEQAYKFCLLGATEAEMANFFEVAIDTITEWKKVYPEFSASLKEGRDQADAEVSDKLRRRAEGYEWDEVVPMKLKNVVYEGGKRVSETETIKEVVVHRVVPPDPTSAIFWLKNRRPQSWRDKQEIDHTTNGKELPTPILATLVKPE